MPPLFALGLVGCSSTVTASNNGAGFEKLTPSPATRTFIVKNDLPFARQVAGHNTTCDAQPACRK